MSEYWAREGEPLVADAPATSVQDAPPPGVAATNGPLSRHIRLYLTHLRVERGLSENTLAAYARDLRRYDAFLAARGVDDVAALTWQDIEACVQACRLGSDGGRPLASSSAARFVASVRGLHRYLASEGDAPRDVSADVSRPVVPKSLPKALEIDAVEALLATAAAQPGAAGMRNSALLEFLYATGARISEAVGLDVDDVSLTEPASVLLRGKGRKERVVPVGSHAVAALRHYLTVGRPELAAKGQGGPALFLNARGQRLSRQSAWAVLNGAATQAGLGEHVSPHVLRHSFATHILAAGADVRVVQELLGHASVTTTQIYTRVTAQTLREVYATSHPRAR
ncbi:MAG: site-specific tyrosine recombinase XerD [Buchananella hordeovulneris]|nr:site-specific tyrosine recombinase XerD [Buchananella hordeovulneris]